MNELRIVLIEDPATGDWNRRDFQELRDGDNFKLYECNGEFVGQFTAKGELFLNKGVWAIIT